MLVSCIISLSSIFLVPETNMFQSNLWQGWCWQQCGSDRERWHGGCCCCSSCGCSVGSDGGAGSQSKRVVAHPNKRGSAMILENSTVRKRLIKQFLICCSLFLNTASLIPENMTYVPWFHPSVFFLIAYKHMKKFQIMRSCMHLHRDLDLLK